MTDWKLQEQNWYFIMDFEKHCYKGGIPKHIAILDRDTSVY